MSDRGGHRWAPEGVYQVIRAPGSPHFCSPPPRPDPRRRPASRGVRLWADFGTGTIGPENLDGTGAAGLNIVANTHTKTVKLVKR